MIRKRITAYLIDMLIVTIISSFIYTVPIFASSQEEYLNNYENYTNTYREFIKGNKTEEDIINSEYKMIKSSSTILIIRVGIIIAYFSIIPYFKNGQTLGKKINKIKVFSSNKKEIKPSVYFIRGLISSVVIFDLINLFVLILCNRQTYLITSGIISYLTYLFYIASLICILITKERKSLHDLLLNTKIIETKQILNQNL